MNHFALRSKRVVSHGSVKPATVEIKDGIIAGVHSYQHETDYPVEDLGNHVILPGLVDTHVHINEPGRTDWEGFNTATQAAAAGGITTLVDMPLNCIPVTTTKAAFEEKLAAIDGKLWVDCGFWGGVIPQNIDDLDDLLTAGVLGVKSFLIDSGIEEFPNVSENDIRRAIPILAKHNVPYLIHAELDKDNLEPASIGKKYQSFLASRPKAWENDAIELMIRMGLEAKENGIDGHIHIVHLSSAEALAMLADAKSRGLNITAETCPHYLTLFAENIPDGKTLFKCCPPIREDINREQLWDGIKTGLIDFIVSDHSPCTPQLKHIDTGDLENAWGGISALQFGLPLIWTEAKERGFNLPDMARLMAEKTAQFAGLGHFKGKIDVGYQADILVFDEEHSFTIDNSMIKHKHKITPYEQKQVSGRVERTYLKGNLVYQHDQYIGEPSGTALLKQKL